MMIDIRYNDDNFIPPIENGEEIFKYRTLVKSLLDLEKKFEHEDFEFMRGNNRTFNYGFTNHQLHYFLFCIDWKHIYFVNSTIEKLTLYDIFINTPTKDTKKRLKELQVSYLCLKALFNGDMEIQLFGKNYSFKEMLVTVINSISIGLRGCGVDKGSRKKGIHELIRHIFTELSNVDYEFEDFTKPYSDRSLRVSKVLINIFDRFAIASTFNKYYKTKFGLGVRGMILSETAITHILLRHTVPCKIYYNKVSNAEHQNKKIKNGLGEEVSVTAHSVDEKNKYPIEVTGDDGVFYMPNFSTKQEDFLQFRSSNQKITNEIIETSTNRLNQLLCKLVQILEEKYDNSKSPNIIYLEGVLYGIEVNNYQGNTIESFYPLNSESQEKNGIIMKDIDRIINKEAIPDGFLRIIDNE